MIDDLRIALLPKWAQRYIEGLERRVEGHIDLKPGAVNYVTLTRNERKGMVAFDLRLPTKQTENSHGDR